MFEGADDFVVPEQSYWNISAVSWFGFFESPLQPILNWKLNVYSDGGLNIGTSSYGKLLHDEELCLTVTFKVPGALEFQGTSNVTITSYSAFLNIQMFNLTSPLILWPGRHWVSLYPVSASNSSKWSHLLQFTDS